MEIFTNPVHHERGSQKEREGGREGEKEEGREIGMGRRNAVVVYIDMFIVFKIILF